MIDFPNSPTVGQQFTAAGVTWTWDGTKWTGNGLNTPYLPLAGGTLSGPLTLAGNPTVPLGSATKQYVDAGDLLNSAGGFINKFRNGAFTIWQRGVGPISIAAGLNGYTADGWIVAPTGAAAGVGLGGRMSGAYSRSSFIIAGASGLTGCFVQHRIESYVASPLAGRTCTFQCRVLNNMANPVTLVLSTQIMNTPDVAAPNTGDLPPTSLQTIAAGAIGVVALTFNVGANAANGYIVNLNYGASLNAATGNIVITDCDLRATPGIPVGLNANPPVPEMRDVVTDALFCLRYFWALPGGSNLYYLGLTTPNFSWPSQPTILFPVSMRGSPTMLNAVFTTSSPPAGTPGYGAVTSQCATINNPVNNWTQGNFAATVALSAQFSVEL
jgi:hypothetical protein